MATQVILDLMVFVVAYVATGVLLIEIVMWLMGRLDPAASATAPCQAVESQLGSTLAVQAYIGRTYPAEGCMSKTADADQFRCNCPSGPLLQILEESQEPVSYVGIKPDTEIFPQIVLDDHLGGARQMLGSDFQSQ